MPEIKVELTENVSNKLIKILENHGLSPSTMITTLLNKIYLKGGIPSEIIGLIKQDTNPKPNKNVSLQELFDLIKKSDKNTCITTAVGAGSRALTEQIIDEAIQSDTGVFLAVHPISTNLSYIDKLKDDCRSNNKTLKVIDLDVLVDKKNKPPIYYNPFRKKSPEQAANIILRLANQSGTYTFKKDDVSILAKIIKQGFAGRFRLMSCISIYKWLLKCREDDIFIKSQQQLISVAAAALEPYNRSAVTPLVREVNASSNYFDIADVFINGHILTFSHTLDANHILGFGLIQKLMTADFLFNLDNLRDTKSLKRSKIITSEAYILSDQSYMGFCRSLGAQAIHYDAELPYISFSGNTLNYFYNSGYMINFNSHQSKVDANNQHYDILSRPIMDEYNKLQLDEYQLIEDSEHKTYKKF